MLHTVLFDLDGTLTDSREGILKSLRYALDKMGEPVPAEDILLRFIGPPLTDSFARWCGFPLEKGREAVRLFRERYEPVGKFENAAAPGMVDLCRRLAEDGYTLAVASSKPERMCVPICEKFGFAPYLAVIAGSPPGDDWDKTRVLAEALRRLNVTPDRLNTAVMVGDRKYDVEGARAVGLRCLGVEFFGYADPGELKAAGALAVVRTPEELEAAIRSLSREKGETP